MVVLNHLPFPGYENLTLGEVFGKYKDKKEAEFDLCMIFSPELHPMRAKPEAIFLLSDLAVNGRKPGIRILSGVERELLGGLPRAFVSDLFEGADIPSDSLARISEYSFYHR